MKQCPLSLLIMLTLGGLLFSGCRIVSVHNEIHNHHGTVSVESLQEQSADKPIGEISPKVDIPLL